MSDTGLESCVAVVIGAGLGGGIGSTLSFAGAAVVSDAASFITEQTVEIDGGWAMY